MICINLIDFTEGIFIIEMHSKQTNGKLTIKSHLNTITWPIEHNDTNLHVRIMNAVFMLSIITETYVNS